MGAVASEASDLLLPLGTCLGLERPLQEGSGH